MKYFLKFIAGITTAILFYLNCTLYHKPQFVKIENQVINKDVYDQLLFLKTALNNGAGKEMQRLFPEGFVFINAIYGLSWYEVIGNLKIESQVYQEGIVQMRYALQQINSAYGINLYI